MCDHRPAVHFVGFRSEAQAARAAQVFGRPDFTHRKNDPRFRFGGEWAPGDVAVFANGAEANPVDFLVDDSADGR